jgi:hypothetical protein
VCAYYTCSCAGLKPDNVSACLVALVIISWMIASLASVNWPVESRGAGEAVPLPSVAITLKIGETNEGRGCD